MRKNTKIISTYPLCGKKYLLNDNDVLKNINMTLLNLETEDYKDDKSGISNYIKTIKDNIGKVDIIFVDSNKEVRDALKENMIDYLLVYPKYSALSEWVGRAVLSNKEYSYINELISKWYDSILDMDNEDGPHKSIRLGKEMYLYDALFAPLISNKNTNVNEDGGLENVK